MTWTCEKCIIGVITFVSRSGLREKGKKKRKKKEGGRLKCHVRSMRFRHRRFLEFWIRQLISTQERVTTKSATLVTVASGDKQRGLSRQKFLEMGNCARLVRWRIMSTTHCIHFFHWLIFSYAIFHCELVIWHKFLWLYRQTCQNLENIANAKD